jgi:hypothetical protein
MPVSLGITGLALSANFEYNLFIGIYWVVAIGLNIALVIADSNELKKHEIQSSIPLGIIFIPAYLYKRAKLVSAPQIGLIIWVASFILSFLIDTIGASNIGSQQSTDGVEASISTWLVENQFSDSDVSVVCPDTVLSKPQATFLCTANSAFGDINLQVTIENTDGDVTWQVVG